MSAAVIAARAVALAVVLAGCRRDDGARLEGGAAQRIVSLGPATTEALFAVGAGDRVVGRSTFCDYPPAAKSLPAVGGMEPDVEAILALRPDLVVGPSGGWSARLAATLGARGVATWFPEEIRSLQGVDAMILTLAARAGHEADGRRVVSAVDAAEGAIDRDVAGAPRPRVLLVVATMPVVVAGPGGFAADLVRRAGGDNVVVEGGAWPALGFERILELDPDVVLDASMSAGEPSRITAGAPGWSGVRAVRAGRVVALADERVLRPGPRIAEGLALLERALHPPL